MKWAVLSDIHGNLPALEAVLKHAKDQHVDEIIFTGDVVGHGPSSQACLSKLYEVIGKESWKQNCKGNNDKALHTGTWKDMTVEDSRISLEWAANEVSKEGLKWLEQLSEKPVRRGDLFTVVHGTLMDSVGEFTYMYDNDFNIIESFLLLETAVGIFGHTHRPAIYKAIPKPPPHIFRFDKIIPKELGSNSSQNEIQTVEYSFEEDLVKSKKILVGAGSVGQPRDGDWRTSYLIIDDVKHVFYFYRLPYDIEKVIQALSELEGKYPKEVIERTKKRLRVGN
jgi:predicted phosphodiesterase